ncbi:hypothetical protein [Streptomyces sp.]|uniref:hypothetical protein n=1 Tax=Streptomyces sp. TaxID=1931 RepID=UPI002F930E4B
MIPEQIGCGIQELIDTLAADAQRVLAEYEAAQTAGYDRGTDLTARELQGLRIGLGRILAWRDGLPAEHVVSAFNRGRDYQDRLPTAERRAS